MTLPLRPFLHCTTTAQAQVQSTNWNKEPRQQTPGQKRPLESHQCAGCAGIYSAPEDPPPSLTNCVSSSQACSCLERTSENYFTPGNVCFITDKARGSRQASNHSCPQVTYLSLPNGLKYVTTQSTQSRFILVPTLVQTVLREVGL